MRQNIRQLLLFPIGFGFWMAPILSGPMIVSIPIAFASAEDAPISTVPPTPKSRLLSGMAPLRQLVTPPTPAPVIVLNSPGFSFSAAQGNSPPPPQILTVNSKGRGKLNWNATTSAAWLTLSPTSGIDNGTVTVTPVLGSLTAATYTSSITLSAPGAQPVSIPVTFTVIPSPTSISLTPSSLTYIGVSGGTNPATQAVTVTSTGTWTASASADWIKLSTTSGSGNGTIIAGVNIRGLVGTTSTGTITVTAGNMTKTVSVTLTLSTGFLTLSSNKLAFTATQGSENPPSRDITVQSNGSWTATAKASWLSLSQTSGSNNGTITASVDISKAQQGENQTILTVASGGIIRTVTITLTVGNPFATLTWRPNSETDLAGYKIYRSTIRGRYEPQNAIALVQKNVTTYQVTALQPRITYYFVVTAFDLAGNESGYSNEVSKSVY